MSSNNQPISFSILSCLIKMCEFDKILSSCKSLRELNSIVFTVHCVISAFHLPTPEVVETCLFFSGRSQDWLQIIGCGVCSDLVYFFLNQSLKDYILCVCV